MPNKPHHSGAYRHEARLVRAQANADPMTRCWRCGKTLAQHPRHKTGRAPYWTAGHVVDSQRGGRLAPEVSTCNFSAGATTGNRRRSSPNAW